MIKNVNEFIVLKWINELNNCHSYFQVFYIFCETTEKLILLAYTVFVIETNIYETVILHSWDKNLLEVLKYEV